MQHIWYRYAVAILGLNEERRLGYQPLQGAFGTFVAWPPGLVSKQETGVSQVSVEPPGEMIHRRNVRRVLPKDANQGVAERPLTHPPASFQHQRDLGALGRVLYCPGIPVR